MYRRITPHWYIQDASGKHRVSTQAFQDKGGAMSVALGVVLDSLGLAPAVVIEGFPGFGLVLLRVGFLRASLKLGVVAAPTPEEPWHGEVYGKKTGSVQRQLARSCEWVRRPETD